MGLKFNFGKRSEGERQRVREERERRKEEKARRKEARRVAREEAKRLKRAKKAAVRAAKARAREEKKASKENKEAKPEEGLKAGEKKASAREEGLKTRSAGAPGKVFFFRRLFRRKRKGEQSTEETKQSDAPSHSTELEERAARLAKKNAKRRKKRKERVKRDAQHRKKMLGTLLRKAGYGIKPERVKEVVLFLSVGFLALFTLVTLLIAVVYHKELGSLLLFYLGLWTAVFAFLYLFILMVIYVFLDIRIYRRTRELEEVLPDFLQLASANISAGMPIDRALWFAVRPNFGVLAKEIEEVAKATLAGEELSQSLISFTDRYESATLRRSISILLEGLAAGGEMAELLNKIALNIQETKILRKEMSANVATYAIFITFASIVMAPLLFALGTELLRIIVTITSSIDISGSGGGFMSLTLSTSPKMIDDFRWFSIMMLSVSALMSASIVSVIRRGRIKEGIRNLPIFLAVSLSLYMLAISALHYLLSGLIG